MSFVCRMQLTLESLSNMSFLFLIVETIDTSAFDNIIQVEGGDLFEFINEHKQAVPSSITYLLKEGSI